MTEILAEGQAQQDSRRQAREQAKLDRQRVRSELKAKQLRILARLELEPGSVQHQAALEHVRGEQDLLRQVTELGTMLRLLLLHLPVGLRVIYSEALTHLDDGIHGKRPLAAAVEAAFTLVQAIWADLAMSAAAVVVVLTSERRTEALAALSFITGQDEKVLDRGSRSQPVQDKLADRGAPAAAAELLDSDGMSARTITRRCAQLKALFSRVLSTG